MLRVHLAGEFICDHTNVKVKAYMHLMALCLNHYINRHIKVIGYALDGVVLIPSLRTTYKNESFYILIA